MVRGDARATQSRARPISGRDRTSVGDQWFVSRAHGWWSARDEDWFVARWAPWSCGWAPSSAQLALHASARAVEPKRPNKKGTLRRPTSRLGPIRRHPTYLHRFRRRIVVVSVFSDLWGGCFTLRSCADVSRGRVRRQTSSRKRSGSKSLSNACARTPNDSAARRRRKEWSAGDRDQSAGDRDQSAGDREQSAGDRARSSAARACGVRDRLATYTARVIPSGGCETNT